MGGRKYRKNNSRGALTLSSHRKKNRGENLKNWMEKKMRKSAEESSRSNHITDVKIKEEIIEEWEESVQPMRKSDEGMNLAEAKSLSNDVENSSELHVRMDIKIEEENSEERNTSKGSHPWNLSGEINIKEGNPAIWKKRITNMYAIIEFDDGVEIVPNIWLYDNDKCCLWPTNTARSKLDKLVKNKSPPERKWASYKVKKIFKKTDEYSDAEENLQKAREQSDIDSEREEPCTSTQNRKRAEITISSSDEEDYPEKKFKSPLPQPPKSKRSQEPTFRTPINSTQNQLTRTNSREENQLPKISKADRNKDFESKILSKLNRILINQKAIEDRIEALERKHLENTLNEEKIEEINTKFPFETHEDVMKIEELLKNKEDFVNVVDSLKLVGGADENDMVKKIMKKIISDEMAENFNWHGRNSKISFKALVLPRVILKSVRCCFPAATKNKVFRCIAKHLKYAKQRRDRLLLKPCDDNESI